MVFRDVSSGSVRGERSKWGVGNRCGRFCGGNSGVWVRKFKNMVVSREGEVWGRSVDGLGEPGVIVHLDVEGRL